MTVNSILSTLKSQPASERTPVLFLGHGSPMNALEDNAWTRSWQQLGRDLPRPQAVLCVSAHWLTEGETLVHVAPKPKTIHDFWGFPKELYDVQYPAPGAPEAARQAAAAVHAARVKEDTEWGLDHGTWSVLRHLYPEADVPTFQMSIDLSRHGDYHYALGRELAALRERGVLIVGSGNIVHNLGLVNFRPDAAPYDWAMEFDTLSKELLRKGDDARLVDYRALGAAAHLSIPTPDHYWPLLYTLGARDAGEPTSFVAEGVAFGSVSMTAVRFG